MTTKKYSRKETLRALRDNPELLVTHRMSPTDLIVYREVLKQEGPRSFREISAGMVTYHPESSIRKALSRLEEYGFVIKTLNSSHVSFYMPFTSTKACPHCGNTDLVLLSTMNKKVCTDCETQISWLRFEGEEEF